MSLTPESFDALFAGKLAQATEPAYDPTHWDQLEDHLQHLNQGLQTQQAAQSAAPTPPPAALPGASWLAGPLAKLGVVAALTGLTATNAYLVLRREQQPAAPVSAPAAASPSPLVDSKLSDQPAAAPQSAPAVTMTQAAPLQRATRDRQAATPATADPATKQSQVSFDLPITLPAPLSTTAAEAVETLTVPTAAPTIAGDKPAPRPDSARVSAKAAPAGSAGQGEPTATVLDRLALVAPNIITPNGDGLNDRFELPLPVGSCRLVIFDRNGNAVYTNDHYDNTWSATGQPAGTYFYTISTGGESPWRTTGTLTVQR